MRLSSSKNGVFVGSEQLIEFISCSAVLIVCYLARSDTHVYSNLASFRLPCYSPALLSVVCAYVFQTTLSFHMDNTSLLSRQRNAGFDSAPPINFVCKHCISSIENKLFKGWSKIL